MCTLLIKALLGELDAYLRQTEDFHASSNSVGVRNVLNECVLREKFVQSTSAYGLLTHVELTYRAGIATYALYRASYTTLTAA